MWQVVIQLTKTWRELFGARSPGRRGPSWRDGARPPREGASCPRPSLPGRRGPAFAAVSRTSVWSPSGAAGCGVSGAPCRTGPRTRSCGRRTASLRLPSRRAAARRESADGRRGAPALLQVCASISAPRFSFQQRLLPTALCVLPASPAGAHRCARGPHAGFPRVNELTKAVLLPARAGRRAGRRTLPSVTPCHIAVPSRVSLHGSDQDPTFAKSTVLVLSWGDRVPFPGDTRQWGHGWVSWLWGLPLAPGGQMPGCR